MTYRKLYLWILVTAGVVVLGVWWISLRTYAGCFVSPGARHGTPCGGVITTLTPGSLMVGYGAEVAWPEQFSFGSAPVAQLKAGDTLDRLQLLRRGSWGTFQIGRVNPIGVPPEVQVLAVEFPVWLPWFFLAGGGYTLVRRMEKRSRGVKEKALAESTVASGAVE